MVEGDNPPLAEHPRHLSPQTLFVLEDGVGLALPQPLHRLVALLKLGLCLTASHLVSSPRAAPERGLDHEQVSPPPPR